MRHVSVISEHLISTGFRGLTGSQRDPRVGVSHFLCPDIVFKSLFGNHNLKTNFLI